MDEPYNCYDDLDHCDVLILWGNNFAEMHPVLFSRFIDRKLKGDKITLVDLTTRLTRTSERADHVLVFQPQSDLSIANCIAQQVIAANAVATDFVDRHCTFRKPWKKAGDPQALMGEPCTFDEYKQFVAEYTPEAVAKTSGLSVEQLQLLDARDGGKCPKGHVFVPFFDETKLINRLTLEAHCPFSKEPDYKKCAVRLIKVSG